MLKCKICGSNFEVRIKNHYISRGNERTGLVSVLAGNESQLWDTFDCPECGCQVLAQSRNRRCSEYYDESIDEEIIIQKEDAAKVDGSAFDPAGMVDG